MSGVELVIEAIFENLAAKHELLRSLEQLCPQETIIASNTSSFMPSRLAEALSHPERLVIAHYFNPPYLIPLVEVVPGPSTSKGTVTTMVELLEKVGKKPVFLAREATGFVANRLQMALYREALAIVEQGIAEPEAVDSVVKYGFGRRLAAAGPFEIFDLAGLDTILAVASQILPVIAASSRHSIPCRNSSPDRRARQPRRQVGPRLSRLAARDRRGAEEKAGRGPGPGGTDQVAESLVDRRYNGRCRKIPSASPSRAGSR